MLVSEICVPRVGSMGQVKTALEDILERRLGAGELADLKELVASLDLVAWDLDGAASAGIMIGLLAGLKAGVAEGRIRAIRGRAGRPQSLRSLAA